MTRRPHGPGCRKSAGGEVGGRMASFASGASNRDVDSGGQLHQWRAAIVREGQSRSMAAGTTRRDTRVAHGPGIKVAGNIGGGGMAAIARRRSCNMSGGFDHHTHIAQS